MKDILFKSAIILSLLASYVSFGFAKATLVVVNRAESTVSIIDVDEMKVLATIPVGTGPHEVVVSADGKTAIVSIYGEQTSGSSFSIIDIASQKETKRVDILPMMRPHGLVETGGKIYFSSEVNRAIGRFDLTAQKVDWVMGTGQSGTHMLVVTPDQKRFYTANVGSDSVTAFEFGNVPPAQSKVTQITVGKQPEAIDISPNGKEVWVGLNAEGAIDIVDTATNKVVEKVKLGERPYRVRFTPDGKLLVATMPNTKELIVIDIATRKEIKRIKLESVPLGLIFSKDGKTAFVTATQSDFVLKLDVEKGEILSKVAVGKAPDGIALVGM
jgi:YVTN family beta-propeller protein